MSGEYAAPDTLEELFGDEAMRSMPKTLVDDRTDFDLEVVPFVAGDDLPPVVTGIGRAVGTGGWRSPVDPTMSRFGRFSSWMYPR